MRTIAVFAFLSAAFCFPGVSSAADNVAERVWTAQKNARSRMLFGQPVNVSISGGGSLPKGRALTIINASFADKSKSVNGGVGTDAFSRTWLFKFRYGITNRLEFSATSPYAHNRRSPKPANAPEIIEGFGDQIAALVYAPWNEHQGDPVSASVYAGFFLPTGLRGPSRPPGNGVWGGRYAVGIGKRFNGNFVADTEVVYALPFARGNQQVKRGDMVQWNTNIRYLFHRFDLGLESSLTAQESGDRATPAGRVNLRNGYTDWFVGPSVNVGIDPLNMWAGIGAFFPVLQRFRGPAAVERARYECKVGVLW
jgi:hypothetical protein